MDKKVVFFDFANLNYGGGCEKNFMKFGNWLFKKGYDVSFVTGSHKLNKWLSEVINSDEYKKNISDQDLRKVFGVKDYLKFSLVDLFFPTKNRRQIKRTLKEADVIVSKNEVFDIIPLKFLFFTSPKKIVFGFHTPLYYPVTRDFKSKFHNWLYNSFIYHWMIFNSRNRLLVLTYDDKKLLSRANPKNITVIPNPLDTKKFYQKEYKMRDKFKVYFIGRMTEQKGVDILYESIILLSKEKEFENMEFYFIGSGNQEHYFIELSNSFENCHFLGFKTDVVKYYHDADILIAPSRWETYCYSVAEAASCGVPVIASNIPGPNQLIINNKTGLLIKPNEVNELKQAIFNLYSLWKNNYKDFVLNGISARKYIVDNFEEDLINKRVEKFIIQNE
ncbi:glycosyltransferase [Candidatus Pacearchaeota archaeon]|nr:glycosyltransferase [Candidatus Pacearchaeota archaeon]